MGTGIDLWGSGVADSVWPWLALGVLGAGAILTLASGLAPLRGLAAGLRGWTKGSADDESRHGQITLLAAAAGMGGISGATLAVTIGGPGALPWMWIATLLGMGLMFAEGALGSLRPGASGSVLHLSKAGPVGQLLAPVYALSILAVAILAGAMLQTHEAASILEQAMWVPPPSTAVGLALAAVIFLFSPVARKLLMAIIPAALVVLAVTAAFVVFADAMYLQMRIGDAFNAAFQSDAAKGGTAGGVVAVALHHGVLRATLAGHAGLGTAGLAGLRSTRPGHAGAVAMLVAPLTAGVLGTLAALVLLTGSGPESIMPDQAPAPLTEEELAAQTPADKFDPGFAKAVASRHTVPLERAFADGLSPSQQVGQTIVVPEFAEVEAGNHYGMVLRPHPRGHAMAKFDASRNAVIMPSWQISHEVDEIIFRAEDEERSKYAAWDIRIPVNRELGAPQPGAKEFLKLTPKDPDIDLEKLVRSLGLSKQVYVPLTDFHFIGRAARAVTGERGVHLAVFEPSRTDRDFNPKLHEFYRNSYRGPYADDGAEAPPFAFVGEPEYQPPVGSVARLVLQSHPRGEPFIRVTRGGKLITPPWDFLLGVKKIVLRHATDPKKDYFLEVEASYDAFQIHLKPTAGKVDFTQIEEGWTGPYAIVPDVHFEADVHGDDRLPPELSGRRTLVPRHPSEAPQGPHGDKYPYTPHPSDVLALGMNAPTLDVEGSARVAMRISGQLGVVGKMCMVMCTIVLALGTLVAWSMISEPVATALGGQVLAKAMPILLLGAAVTGAWISLPQLVAVLDVALAIAVAANLVGLVAGLPKIIAAGRDLGKRD